MPIVTSITSQVTGSMKCTKHDFVTRLRLSCTNYGQVSQEQRSIITSQRMWNRMRIRLRGIWCAWRQMSSCTWIERPLLLLMKLMRTLLSSCGFICRGRASCLTRSGRWSGPWSKCSMGSLDLASSQMLTRTIVWMWHSLQVMVYYSKESRMISTTASHRHSKQSWFAQWVKKLK